MGLKISERAQQELRKEDSGRGPDGDGQQILSPESEKEGDRDAGGGGDYVIRGKEHRGDRHDAQHRIGHIVQEGEHEAVPDLPLDQHQRHGADQIGHERHCKQVWEKTIKLHRPSPSPPPGTEPRSRQPPGPSR